MLSISSGFTFNNSANFSSLALVGSKSLLASFCQTLPFTTIRGSELPLMELTPRRRIVVPAPRLPELATMSRPEIRPWRASSTEVIPRPSNSFMSMRCWATEISVTGMAKPELSLLRWAFTTTSFSVVALCMCTLKTLRSIGSTTVL